MADNAKTRAETIQVRHERVKRHLTERGEPRGTADEGSAVGTGDSSTRRTDTAALMSRAPRDEGGGSRTSTAERPVS